MNIEDIDMIASGENFFGVNFGTGRILGAPASEFASIAGDILLTQEFHSGSGLFRLFWDGKAPQNEELHLGAGSFIPGQWEHVTFAPVGIVEIPPVDPRIPEPSTFAIWSVLGCLGLIPSRRRQRS